MAAEMHQILDEHVLNAFQDIDTYLDKYPEEIECIPSREDFLKYQRVYEDRKNTHTIDNYKYKLETLERLTKTLAVIIMCLKLENSSR